jgi:hypothetical protein
VATKLEQDMAHSRLTNEQLFCGSRNAPFFHEQLEREQKIQVEISQFGHLSS